MLSGSRAFYPKKVCYFENLELLRAKTDAEDGQVYCIAMFMDCAGKNWTISFTPGRDKALARQIRSAASLNGELEMAAKGYFLIEQIEELPFEADSFYTVYGSQYADGAGQNILQLNAEYLCGGDDSYTLRTLLRPGIPLASFVTGMFGVISGGMSLIGNRKRR